MPQRNTAPPGVSRAVGVMERRAVAPRHPGGPGGGGAAVLSEAYTPAPRGCLPQAVASATMRHGGRAHRLLRLELRQLARALLPRGPAPAPVAGALRLGVRHRRGQRHLLPPADAPGGGGLGAAD